MGVITSTFGGKVVWSFVSQFEVAEGILVVAAVSFFIVAMEYLGFGSLFNNYLLRRHVRSPLSYLCVLFATVGALCFDLLVLCNFKELNRVIDINGWNLVQYPLSIFGYLGGGAMGDGGRLGYGALALLIWGLTVVALSFGTGFSRAVKLFALPSILFLTVVVFLFDPREMSSQAINLVSGVTFKGISLLSNWSLLTVSLFFTVFNLARMRPGRKDIARLRRSRWSSSLSRALHPSTYDARARRESRDR
jgi:hypothetical protein